MNQKNQIKLTYSEEKDMDEDSFTSPKKMEHFSIESESKDTESNIVEEMLDKIGMGKYQYLSFLSIGIAWFTDGAQVLALAILNYVIVSVVWFENIDDVGLLGFFVFAGFFIGSLASGIISDKYGRKKPFLIYAFSMFLMGLGSALAPNFAILSLTRFIFGIFVGLVTPCSYSYQIEISARKSRGAACILLGSLFSFGELFTILIAWLLAVEQKGNTSWRAMMIWTSIPGLISAIIGYLYLDESPRYALQKSANEGIKVIQNMFYKNHGYELKISDYERDKLNEWSEHHNKPENQMPLSELFKGSNRKITILLWIIWWVLSFVYYGIIYVLPLVIAEINNENSSSSQNIDYYDLTTAVLAEMPAYVVGMLIVEKKKFGRKNSAIISFGSCCISCICIAFFPLSFFMVFVFIAKFFANAAFEVMSPYTSELYPTSCRATGFGFASAASRIGGMMMPYIIVATYGLSPSVPFVIFGIASGIASLACAFLPYDTAGVALDQKKN